MNNNVALNSAMALWLGALGLAQSASFEGKTILELRYEPSPQPLAPDDLQRVQLLRTGAPFQASEVAETIDRMFATGRYEDIQVDAESRDNGAAVRFLTRSARFGGTRRHDGKDRQPAEGQTIASRKDAKEQYMSLFAWLLLGLVSGFIASHLVNHRGEGMVLDILLGIVGAIVGGWLFHLFGAIGVAQFNLYGLIVAVAGAVVVLFVYHAIRRGVIGRRIF